MLSTSHKAHLLQRAGITVPPAATTFLLTQVERDAARQRWESTVENLFIAYAMARAEKSLAQGALPSASLPREHMVDASRAANAQPRPLPA